MLPSLFFGTSFREMNILTPSKVMVILHLFVVFALSLAVNRANSDECRDIRFNPDNKDKYLRNHIIKAVPVENKMICELICYRDPDCVSYNYGPVLSENPLCELNNSTHLQALSENFINRNGYSYRGIENPCGNSPCQSNSICQAGFTSKGYRCVCPRGFGGENCEQVILPQNCSEAPKETGVYKISNHGSDPFPVYCDQTSDGGGWTMIFKYIGGISSSPTGKVLWSSSDTLSENITAALDTSATYQGHYKNRLIQSWQTFNPQEVRVVIYTNGTEVMHMKFNGRGTTNLDWFSQNNLFQSPWTDLKNATNIFIFRIHGAAARSFEIAGNHYGCPRDTGWFLITGPHCPYEKSHPQAIPGILYSKKTHKITWNNNQADVGGAEVLIVYVR
ncbi:uncharacterized protein LOC111330326 isoform X1 [Stylophora pistillata]|uniref:uncharacterized protein LOC111330326 isoform X1 n=2 Tax=Stylophora pistillata TaxID=50429 RepID=UPI000C041FF3|nr:uncharacterized protein LOC111330326 isoform X1 [Stylophora pistillata]